MKTRFSTLDVFAILHDLKSFLNLRLQNVYDIDSKTYLFKFQKPDEKATILIESGTRIHPTEFDWPKNNYPSSFSMKMRKHIKQKRLKSIAQLGIDRIIDMQFGEDQWACHVIVELYDRGNIILTDQDYLILNILRPRTEKDTDVRFAVRQTYPLEKAEQLRPLMSFEDLEEILNQAKPGENLRKILTPRLRYGPALVEHCCKARSIPANAQLGKQILPDDYRNLYEALQEADCLFLDFRSTPASGFIIVKQELKPMGEFGAMESLDTFQEFHPMLFAQFTENCISKGLAVQEFATFAQAVDQFFSKKESQKIDLKALQQQREALKKLDNVKRDHEERIKNLKDSQESGRQQATLIELNKELVDRAISVLRAAIANQHSWADIHELVEEGKVIAQTCWTLEVTDTLEMPANDDRGDPVASAIYALKLDKNQVTMELRYPYAAVASGDDASENEDDIEDEDKPLLVDIDLNLGAYQNARRLYDHKKAAAVKEQKTMDASKKALRSAELKTQETLKNVQIRTAVQKQRRSFWFEKFLWFVSSENYLVIGGRDAQQNELLVKRYLRPGDVYVHADLRGATSVVVKNTAEGDCVGEIGPKTLNEAGAMAVCFSAAWEAKVVSGAWWVAAHQVSKTAPPGEYLTPGSFMIRGKKNYLPSVQLQMGFGFLFKLEEESVQRRREERNREVDRREEDVAEEEAVEQEEGAGDIDIELSEDEKEAWNDAANESDSAEFPDVTVQLGHLNVRGVETAASDENDYTVLQVGPNRPEKTVVRPQEAAEIGEGVENSETLEMEGTKALKRGQKHKQKKLKQKYKDQDSEEKTLRMEILGSAGPPKPKGKKDKGKTKGPKNPAKFFRQDKVSVSQINTQKTVVQTAEKIKSGEYLREPPANEVENMKVAQVETAKVEQVENMKVAAEEEAEHEDEPLSELETSGALDSLTANPLIDDLLQFAVPVCGPYQSMAGYKYRVKLTPGTGKKGKATKTALQMFLREKLASQRERDLLRAVMDQDLGRNLPGKVKVSAPQLLAVKLQMKAK